jgi:Outer membrane protein beta-barrel domain
MNNKIVFMKQIKSAAIMVGILLLATNSFSQTSFAVRAGIQFFNLNGKDENGDNLGNKLNTGFHIGANAEIPVAEDFYVQPELLFSVKGAKTKYSGSDVKTKLNYLELPVNFLYKPALGEGKLLLGFGPYLAYGLGGKVTDGSNEADVKFDNSPGTSLDAVYLKPIDAGANILFGYEFANRVSAQFNAQLGLVNINPYSSDAVIKNTGFGFSVGYRFGE